MLFQNPWPYVPTKLSDLIELEVLTALLSGCCARLGRATAVLDYDHTTDQFYRIDPLIARQNFSPFCRFLRDDKRVLGGDNACEACDIGRARILIDKWHKEQKIFPKLPQEYHCHMGLIDFSSVICVRDVPVAVLLTGQFRSVVPPELSRKRVHDIANGRDPKISFLQAEVEEMLLRQADRLSPASSGFETQVRQEVELLQRFAGDRYQKQKSDKEQAFLDELRQTRRFGVVNSLQKVRVETEELLRQVCAFCHCKYVIFFTNIGPDDTVLTPLAHSNLEVAGELPHFNWKKAGLRKYNEEAYDRLLLRSDPAVERGIRGNNVQALSDATFAIASTLGATYRGVMILGPFTALKKAELESSFLFQIIRIVSWLVSTKLQSLRLSTESKKREVTTTLLKHRVGTALTPITSHLDSATLNLDALPISLTDLKSAKGSIEVAHKLSIQLGKAVREEIVRTTDIMVEHDDLNFDTYPLSVLVANCAGGFEQRASERRRKLIIDPSIENLPSVKIDIARFSIAISNILDNAVKYSRPSSKIFVRALPMTRSVYVDLEIENLGDSIPQEIMQDIFKRGRRNLAHIKMDKIPGTGYGLWETKAVVNAHGGDIWANSTSTGRYHGRLGETHKVTFTIRIPLR